MTIEEIDREIATLVCMPPAFQYTVYGSQYLSMLRELRSCKEQLESQRWKIIEAVAKALDLPEFRYDPQGNEKIVAILESTN